MSLSHAKLTTSSNTNETISDLLKNVKLITKQTKTDTFSELELKLHQAFADAERQSMAHLLEHYDWDYPGFKSEEKNYRKASRNTKKYMTLAGEVEIERSLYRTQRNGITTCPLELNAGLIDSFWTPQAAKHAIHLVSLITPSEAEHVFKEFGLMTPSKSSLDRLPKKLSQQWEAKQLELDKIIQNDFDIPDDATMCSVSLDGVLIPTRFTRILPCDSRWAEAACGTISFYDPAGEMLSTRYLARMPEHKKKTLKHQLAEHIKSITENRPVLSIIKVADGARDNWTFLDDQIQQGECVLDFYHAAQHLFTAIQCIHGKQTLETALEFKKYRGFLRYDDNGINKVINHLKYHLRKKPELKALKTEITYFTRNKKRCEYARLKSENKPIGSGIVEAACKTVVQIRMKRSGQHWDDQGGQAILTFRSIILSKQFDTAWNEIKNIYLKPLALPNNVVKFERK